MKEDINGGISLSKGSEKLDACCQAINITCF